MKRTILAISGGGFSEEKRAFIDDYLLKIPRKKESLKIAFIGTASDDAQGYIDKFYKAFKAERPTHLSIKDFTSPNIQDIVNALDIVYVGGGNTQYMLHTWRQTEFDTVLKKAYQAGVILAGISAGAMCWFETCYSDNDQGKYEVFKGLGLLQGSLCPHYNHEECRAAFDHWASAQYNGIVYTLADNENVHFINEKLVAKIST
ncbi:peptidase E [Sporolactobacillus shoreicorticis]|uniref:Type 1 glutamine amidotransferase-like domain-containing protein n=1 Tax=Sporolactobacillus shoreicorticis TaxID=1923877 RepID=A0ABW5S714_9BACL|nr:peptidase E [Sporolactobacillus shoreicorticis]MCO7124368.1 peptidase E [Sporolactobacillus shoreicorticis]